MPHTFDAGCISSPDRSLRILNHSWVLSGNVPTNSARKARPASIRYNSSVVFTAATKES